MNCEFTILYNVKEKKRGNYENERRTQLYGKRNG